MGEFSLSHILLLAVILLLFFGPSRLPQLGQSIGKAIRGFKKGLNEDDDSRDVSQRLSHDDEKSFKENVASKEKQDEE